MHQLLFVYLRACFSVFASTYVSVRVFVCERVYVLCMYTHAYAYIRLCVCARVCVWMIEMREMIEMSIMKEKQTSHQKDK